MDSGISTLIRFLIGRLFSADGDDGERIDSSNRFHCPEHAFWEKARNSKPYSKAKIKFEETIVQLSNCQLGG